MPIRWAYLKRVLAGAIFGLYMAHLLYFLNPQIDITPGRLATVTIVYGVICGFLFGSILWGLRWLRVRLFGRPASDNGQRTTDNGYRAHGFGFVVLAAFISSAIYWIHLNVFQIYLPRGAVRILSKATNAIAVTAFLLLLLWVIERNANRRVSRIIFFAGVALIAGSGVLLYERRDSYRTERRDVVVANIGAVAGHRPVLVVAIRNLPYDWIVTMKGEGLVPWLDQATSRAYFTRLEPFETSSPKALWASLATGKLPSRHGVTGRFSYRTPLNANDPFLLLPSGVGFQAWGLIPPVERISAQLPAGDALPLWTLFERVDLRASVVAWPSSRESGASRVITDRAIAKSANPPLPPDVALRFERTGNARARIATALGNDLEAAAQLREGYAVEVLALEGFAEAQKALHVFSNELPARASMKGDALRAYAQQLDRMLAEIARANPGHQIVVCSPSGVVPPDLPADIGSIAVRRFWRADAGADDGFMLVAGADVAHKENPESAYVTDVVPTVLFAAG
ncbi:MAG TPA: hypothetical protein VN181_05280, partial [Thermoanaerobaculia bacterium]|nr:hypothetical protein [Thermoanaerobaculia bacterium]